MITDTEALPLLLRRAIDALMECDRDGDYPLIAELEAAETALAQRQQVPENATEPMQKAMQRAVLLRKSMNDVWRAALSELPSDTTAKLELRSRSDAEILVLADKLFPRWREDIQPQFVLQLARAVLADALTAAPQAAEPTPFKPETWPVDADGDAPHLCTECGTPVRYGSRHSKCAPQAAQAQPQEQPSKSQVKRIATQMGWTPPAGEQAQPQEQKRRADGMPASEDERYLRRLLAVRSGIFGAYFDDGEAHGQEHGIAIDFMREPVAHIDAKLRALNAARALVSAQPQEPPRSAPLTEEPQPGETWHILRHGASACATLEIEEVTPYTIKFKSAVWGVDGERIPRDRVRLVERAHGISTPEEQR